MMTRSLALAAGLAILVPPLPVDAAFLRVDPSGSADFTTVASAMTAAAPGDTIATIVGVHTVTNVEVTEGVQLLGGWDAGFSWRVPGASHLYTPSGRILRFTSGQTRATRVDGFELTHATASAIFCTGSSPTITNNEFHDNTSWEGAAIDCEYGASPLIQGNHVHHNSATYGAGFESHWGSDTSPVIRGNLIEYNDASSAGGGLSVNNGNAVIEDNIIRFNSAGGTGGGVHIWHAGGGVVQVRGNLIILNESRDGGGLGINGGHPVIEYNTFWGNSAWRFGGAISNAESELPEPGTAIIRNNILAGSVDGAGVHCINQFAIALSCNCVFDNADGAYVDCPPPTGDIYEDPQFCDHLGFLLASTSPCAPAQAGICGSIGAFGVGCGPISIDDVSWTSIKAAYR